MIRRRSPSRVNRVFRRAQIVSGSFVAFTHGTNDAQKTMGIIALALITSGHLRRGLRRPRSGWSRRCAMAMGTYAGGWRIIRTMGTRIAKIDPPQGFAAQTACARMLWTTAHFGFPCRRPRRSRARHGRRGEPSLFGGALGDRGKHRHRLGADASRSGPGRHADGSGHPTPRGRPHRLLLVGAIAAAAFIGRS